MGALSDREVYTDEYLEKRRYAGKMLAELHRLNPRMKHSTGVTYLCRLPNGYLKIGTSTQLEQRMKNLNAELLTYVEGGETLELVAHHELDSYRIPCRGEVFFDRPEVYEWFSLRAPEPKASGPPIVHIDCKQCGSRKPWQAFGTHATSKSGYYSTCRDCRFAKLPASMRLRP